MRRTLTMVASMMLALGLASSATAASVPPGGSFYDDDGNVHEATIEAIAADGITRGCNPPRNTQYCPSESVTRGQMAAFLVRALDLPGSSTDFFDDDDGSIFESDIQALRQAGVTLGCNPPANDRYCPDGTVTRGQMAAFLARAFDYPGTGTDVFDDDDGSIFESDINAIAQAGVTKGCNPPANDEYCADASVDRDQMASFLARALDLPPVKLPTRMDLLEDFAVQCQQFDEPAYERCWGVAEWPANQRFYIRHGWGLAPDAQGIPAGTEFRLWVNGTIQTLTTSGVVEIGDERFAAWTKDFPQGRPLGPTEIVGQWVDGGEVQLQVAILVEFADV